MKPNLFNYGVGELTNDAIISWCLDWGNFPDSKLYSLSVDLIRMFTNNNDIEVKNVKIFNQKKNIDILAIVNDKIVLTIEDKLYTKAREGQLKKYKEITKSIYEELDKYYIYIT